MGKTTASDVISVAKAEVGYLEKRSARNEDSKTANAGSNNYTKYGKWLNMDGDYWCASFVSWCFYKAFGQAGGKKLLGTYSASCEVLRNAQSGMGIYHKRAGFTPKTGDIIYFSGSRHSGANHIGIVTKVDGSTVHTVEGNTSGGSAVVDNGGGVAAKRYATNNSRILGYSRPKYDTNTEEKGSTDFDMSTLPTVKNGSTGTVVKTMQAVLKSKYDKSLTVDGKFGSNTKTQLEAVQKSEGLTADGVCGAKTWKAILL